MAQATFTDSSVRTVKSVVETNSKSLKVLPDKTTVHVQPTDYKFSSVDTISYPSAKPIKSLQKTVVEQILPFRVKFTSVSVEGFTSSRPAPIGIAIVGVNNYIL